MRPARRFREERKEECDSSFTSAKPVRLASHDSRVALIRNVFFGPSRERADWKSADGSLGHASNEEKFNT